MPDAFITHNGLFENIDYKKLTDECLDILGYDSYPGFREQNGIGMGRSSSFKLARTRGCSEKFLILEQQSGPGGQLSYLMPTPLPGQIRLWTYQSIAYGAVGVLYFRYRTALFGAEQLWYGIYDHDGEENYRSREIRQITEEISRVGHVFLQERQQNQVAIYYDYNNICCGKAEPFFGDEIWEIYNDLNCKNVQVDFVYTTDKLSEYKAVIFPHVAVADEALAEEIETFSRNGGIAILSSRSGIKDKNAQYRPIKYPGVFRKTAGCRVDWFTSLPQHLSQHVKMNGKTYSVDKYYEMLEVEGGEEIASYTEGFCKNKPAVIKNGNVYYLGFYSTKSPEIYYDILKEHLMLKESIDANLEEIHIGNYKMYLNHGDYPIKISGYDLLKEQEFESILPYGVVLVKQ